MLKSGKIIGTEGPENECGFSFVALSGSVVRAVGRLELGGFAARPILPRCRAAAGGPDCLSGAECGNFSGPLFFFQVQGVGRRLLTGAACYLAGPGLCAAAGAGFASPGRPGLNTAGACRFSRPPMYAACFICFLDMALPAEALFWQGRCWRFRFPPAGSYLRKSDGVKKHSGKSIKKKVRRWL